MDLGWVEGDFPDHDVVAVWAFKPVRELTPVSPRQAGRALRALPVARSPSNGTQGRVAVHDGRHACISQSVAILRPRRDLAPAFLGHALASDPYRARILFEAGGTTIKHIYIGRLAKMAIALPPQSMNEIANFAREQRRRFDGLVREAEMAERLLHERRAALISAAVTGKIDVRDAASRAEAA